MASKPRFPRAEALAATREILAVLQPACRELIVAGSLRRRRDEVGDIEILYIADTETRDKEGTFWEKETVNLADEAISALEARGTLDRRENVLGSTMFGPKNKLMRHCASGIPVDLFAATEENWHNYLVCRTGPKESNVRLAEAAKARGLEWHPYGIGFSGQDGRWIKAESERRVFEIAGVPYAEPWER